MAKTEYTVLKRIIFTFLLALVTALAVHAQSLTGKQWCTVLNDEDLNNQFNNGKAKVDVDYEIKGMDAKTKAMMAKEIKGEINTLKTEFRKVLLGGMPKMDRLKIVKLDSKRLVVKNEDNQEIPFYAE